MLNTLSQVSIISQHSSICIAGTLHTLDTVLDTVPLCDALKTSSTPTLYPAFLNLLSTIYFFNENLTT